MESPRKTLTLSRQSIQDGHVKSKRALFESISNQTESALLQNFEQDFYRRTRTSTRELISPVSSPNRLKNEETRDRRLSMSPTSIDTRSRRALSIAIQGSDHEKEFYRKSTEFSKLVEQSRSKRLIFDEDDLYYEKFGNVIQTENPLPAFIVEQGDEKQREPICNLKIPQDTYALHFFDQKHFNFIVSIGVPEDFWIISVLANVQAGKFRALRTTKKGNEEFFIDETSIISERSANGEIKEHPELLKLKILKYLNFLHPDARITRVKSETFPNDVLQIEQKHPRDNKRCMKIAVIYSKAGQIDPLEMCANVETSKEFKDFLNLLGQRIDLNEWNGYKGDMSKSGHSYFTNWNDLNIMFHVSPMMNAEMQRRLIGNDIAVILFRDPGSSLDASKLDSLGTVPQIFAVVQPTGIADNPKYRMAFLKRVNVKPFFPPVVPKNYLFAEGSVKDFLLTKLANGYITALQCPPMNRLFYVPRTATLMSIIEKNEKNEKNEAIDRKMKEKQKEKEKEKEKERLKSPRGERADSSKVQRTKKEMKVRVINARNLITKEHSDVFCIINVLDQQFNTEAKKNLSWDQKFMFDITGLHETTELVVACLAADFVIQSKLTLGEIMKKYNNKQTWLKLQSTSPPDASGELLVEIAIPK